jgi:hypothetical protein
MGSVTLKANKNDRGEIAPLTNTILGRRHRRLYDHCTVKYLNQAGAKAEWMPLDAKGIHGNGHMVMIEKNHLAIAKVIDDWVRKNIK